MFSYKNEKIDSIIKHRDFIIKREQTQKALEELSRRYGPLPDQNLRAVTRLEHCS
jgi:hypothetical protein